VIWTYLDTVVQTQRNIEAAIRDICDQAVEDDGLEFQSDSVRAEAMKENEEYEGVRVKLLARLASARISIQIDVGFGDVITPAPDDVTYPTILTFPAPILKAYPRETVVAEKFQAMAMLGIVNSRMKDFYDLWTLARQFEFSGPVLSAAIRATFERRQTPLPEQLPIARWCGVGGAEPQGSPLSRLAPNLLRWGIDRGHLRRNAKSLRSHCHE
jgi:hypothetical protein